MNSPTMLWDCWARLPESLHQVTILFADRGTPDGNRMNEPFYVKWFFKTKQGIKNVTRERAAVDPKNTDFSDACFQQAFMDISGRYPMKALHTQGFMNTHQTL
jgi:catalase